MMMKKKKSFKSNQLSIVSLSDHYNHALRLMELANQGVENAAYLAHITLHRYFERVEEELR